MVTDTEIKAAVSRLVEDLYGNESDLVKETIKKRIEWNIRINFNFYLEDSESPIEKAMAIALYDRLIHKQFGDSESFWELSQQQIIEVGEKKYRVDFLLELVNPTGQEVFQIVIECDGFDYHDRTKEQATRDKKRDRDLTLKGYRVMRFTGSEIYKDVDSCINDVIQACFRLTRHWRSR